MNFRVITKNHAADSKMSSAKKSILEPIGLTSPVPTAWELNSWSIVIKFPDEVANKTSNEHQAKENQPRIFSAFLCI